MNNAKIQRRFQIIGAIIIIIFGLDLFLSFFGISFFPKLPSLGQSQAPFLKIFFITISNPMAILFWVGVFSVKIGEMQSGIYTFALGALLATLFFLSLVAFEESFLPSSILTLINAGVGLILICFGIGRLKRPTAT